MALVTITGKAWDASHDPIPATLMPRMFLKLADNSVGAGLLTDDEVDCELQSDGSWSVQVDNEAGPYVPCLDRLVPGQESEAPENRSRRYKEWPSFWPGPGGDISALMPFAGVRGVVAGFGPLTSWPTPVVYLDLADPAGVGVYGPAGWLMEGGA